jgi:hypothetical protein
MELQLHQTVKGIFQPVRVDDLRPEAKKHIGEEIEFIVSWKITGEDSEAYAGDFALVPKDRESYLGWTPSRDVILNTK